VTGEWRTRAARLADELVTAGKLRTPGWRAAVEDTPRHVLVSEWYEPDPASGQWRLRRLGGEAGLDLVYSDTALFVLPGGLSSSSMPGLMTRMLEDLDVTDGHRVLEIGTGTGYNAALLCHRLGDRGVFSVDVEPELVERARERLASLGYHPVLAAADGSGGLPAHAPFDRVIATCSVPRVPWAWIAQTRLGGRLLVDLKIGKQAGNLVHLRRTASGAHGRFDPAFGSFMQLRGATPPQVPAADPGEVTERISTLDLPRPWENTVVWFLAALAMPRLTGFGLRAEPGSTALDTVTISAENGSRCEATAPQDGIRHVRERGQPIWSHIERARELWHQLGRPGWARLGLTVEKDRHVVWLDRPENDLRTLPPWPSPDGFPEQE
jgi:protein-L-isoaspartate(D-aspartate) O-methyltransferase